MANNKLRIGQLIRTNNRDLTRDGELAIIIDSNNHDAVLIKLHTDGKEKWRKFKDVRIVN